VTSVESTFAKPGPASLQSLPDQEVWAGSSNQASLCADPSFDKAVTDWTREPSRVDVNIDGGSSGGRR
jgi:hypothetical protein